MKSFLFFITLFGFTITSVAQKQGISGKVFCLSGNQMPGTGNLQSPQQGVVREIYVYKVTNLRDVEQNDAFFSNIKTEFVIKTFSNKEGFFKIKLPPGEYSVFVKEPQGFFANLFDKDNKINSIIVKPKKFSWLTINIDYEAVY